MVKSSAAGSRYNENALAASRDPSGQQDSILAQVLK